MSINILGLSYEVRISQSDNTILTLAGAALVDLTWEDQIQEIAQRCSLKLTDAQLTRDGKYLHDVVKLGMPLSVWADWGDGMTSVFEGTIFTWSYAHPRTVSITAYDPLYYLQASETQMLVVEKTSAITVLSKFFSDWNLPTGTLAGPKSLMPRLKLTGKIVDCILVILTEAWHDDPVDYVLRWKLGKVEIAYVGENKPVYAFREDSVENFTDEQDITQLITEVKLVHLITANGTSALDPSTIAAFGPYSTDDSTLNTTAPVEKIIHSPFNLNLGTPPIKMQRALTIRTKDDEAGLEDEAGDILDEFGEPKRHQNFTAPDLPFLRKGDRIMLDAGTLRGYYVIAAVSHSAHDRKMQITIDTTGTFKHRMKRHRPENIVAAETFGPDPNSSYDDGTDTPSASGNSSGSGYNPTTVANDGTVGSSTSINKQVSTWDCSAAATAWGLRSIGIPNSDEVTVRDKMVAAGVVIPGTGLANATGGKLASWLSSTYGLNAVARGSSVSFDEVYGLAGSKPILMGGIGWDHWVGVRGGSNGQLLLANSANNWPTDNPVHDTLSPQRFHDLGPMYIVEINAAWPSVTSGRGSTPGN